MSSEKIPLGMRAYFHEQARNELHELVLQEFLKQEQADLISKASLARRIDKAPEQITRWLGAAGNWTIHTVVDLLLGMGVKLQFSLHHLGDGDDPGVSQSQLNTLVPLQDQRTHFARRVADDASMSAVLEHCPDPGELLRAAALTSAASVLGKAERQPPNRWSPALEWQVAANDR